MNHGWFRLCLSAGGSDDDDRGWEILCTWPRTFWFKPVSAFGLLDLTTFISSLPGLAMPSTLAPDRLGVGSRRTPSRDIRPPEGEVTLSQELRTVGLLRPHVLVGFRWSYIGLCPGYKSSHNRHIRSFVSQPPQIRTCPSKRHPALHLMISLRDRLSRGLHGRGEDCIAPPDERTWTTSWVCLGFAETKGVSRSLVLPPELPGGCRSCQ